MKNQKIRIALTALVGIFLVMALGMAVWEKNNKTQIKETKNKEEEIKEQKIENPNSQTSIYKNDKYKYELSIPECYVIKKAGNGNDEDSLIRIYSNQDNSWLFSVHVKKSDFKNIDNWFKNYENKLTKMTSYEGVEVMPPNIIKEEDIVLNGAEAKKITINNMPYSDYEIVIIKNDYIYIYHFI